MAESGHCRLADNRLRSREVRRKHRLDCFEVAASIFGNGVFELLCLLFRLKALG